jgi:N-methylhydantoinase B/oxoprolinase/acetone carboxylase alpha subunit
MPPSILLDPVQDPASLQVIWSRLISISEEMFTTVWRTAFSPVVAVIQDHGCELLDAEGGCLAHAPSSMPAFNLAMPVVTRAVLAKYSRATMQPGDVYITNDPWLSAGHLPDICVVTPVFHREQVVAFCATIAHANDIGGTNDDRRPRTVYEEGLQIPILKLYDQGRPNETLLAMLAANVRGPAEVLGDLEALVAANAVGVRRVQQLLDEYGLEDTRGLAAAIHARTEAAVRAAIAQIPPGVYRGQVEFDALQAPLQIHVTLTVDGDTLHIDYTGSAGEVSPGGINATLSYTRAQTFYSLMCALAPHLPHNEGSLRPFAILAPAGSILNCRFPAPVNLRLRSGWHLNTVLYRALAPVLPHAVMAGSGFLAAFQARGRGPDGSSFNVPYFAGGGQGASAGRDGRAGYIFPSTSAGMSVEIFESRTPLLIHSKQILADSGGAGRRRGGPGQRVVATVRPGWREPVELLMTPDRMICPAPGFAGGAPGAPVRVTVNGAAPAPDSTFYTAGYLTLHSPDDQLVWDFAGGGGWGDPRARESDLVEQDLAAEIITPESARAVYGYDAGARDEKIARSLK